MKVSVCVITYNHEQFIEQCLFSILNQETNFDFEVVIGEDGSTDRTKTIISSLVEKNSNRMVLLPAIGNIGMLPNFTRTIKACEGKYIALCEGDDYWTDVKKLQKQVDFMDQNPDYVMCFHDARRQYNMKSPDLTHRFIGKDICFDVSTEDLLVKNRANTLTVMFRNGLIKDFPEWYYLFSGGDRTLFIMLSQYGKIGYLPFIGAVYRIHAGGASYLRKNPRTKVSAEMTKCNELVAFYDVMISFLGSNYKKLIIDLRNIELLKLINYYLRANELELAFQSVKLLQKNGLKIAILKRANPVVLKLFSKIQKFRNR
jgi:glycosyltransferase involved in cell wall biosynthesis